MKAIVLNVKFNLSYGAIANLYVKYMKKTILLAIGLCMVFTTVGLALSYLLNFTSGATIVLCAAVTYLVSLGINAWRQSRQKGDRTFEEA
ncbi:metal ABC transporter permease [Myxosarcina sp. GI1(2024)]